MLARALAWVDVRHDVPCMGNRSPTHESWWHAMFCRSLRADDHHHETPGLKPWANILSRSAASFLSTV